MDPFSVYPMPLHRSYMNRTWINSILTKIKLTCFSPLFRRNQLVNIIVLQGQCEFRQEGVGHGDPSRPWKRRRRIWRLSKEDDAGVQVQAKSTGTFFTGCSKRRILSAESVFYVHVNLCGQLEQVPQLWLGHLLSVASYTCLQVLLDLTRDYFWRLWFCSIWYLRPSACWTGHSMYNILKRDYQSVHRTRRFTVGIDMIRGWCWC